MSRYMGSWIAGNPPPHLPKTKSGEPPRRHNKYANVKPSEERNTSTQRRARRARAKLELFDALKETL